VRRCLADTHPSSIQQGRESRLLLLSILVSVLDRLQSALEAPAAARELCRVFSVRRSQHITPLLRDLRCSCQFRSGYASVSVFSCSLPPSFLTLARASVRWPTSTAVVTCARRQWHDAHRPARSSTGRSLAPLHGRGTVCRRPSKLHRHCSLSTDDSSRHSLIHFPGFN